jgi:hypothetical protein
MPCPKGTRTKGLTRKYHHNARVAAVKKRARTEAFVAKEAYIASKMAELEEMEKATAVNGQTLDRRTELERVMTIRGESPEPEPRIKPRATLDVGAYKAAARAQGAGMVAGEEGEHVVASTSGGVIGKLTFDGGEEEDGRRGKKRAAGKDARGGEDAVERIGTAARKKKKKNKKLNARRARQC